MRLTEGTGSASHRICFRELFKLLLLLSALSMPVAAPAQTSIVAGPSSPCPTISGQGPVANWTQLSGHVIVNYRQYGSRAVDIADFASTFDYPGLATNSWPGTYGLYAGIHLPNYKYVSARFTVPFGIDMSSWYGQYSIGDIHFTAPISMSISYTCGDFGQFNPSSIVPHCLVNAATAGTALLWQGAPDDQACVLQPAYVYYLNLINADISQLPSTGIAVSTANSACDTGACFDPIINGPGNWGAADDIFYGEFE